MRARAGPILLVLLLLAYVAVSVAPAWHGLHGPHNAKDWASYYYGVQVLAGGGDPYSLSLLQEAAQADGFAQEVYPYLYPPPFLLEVWWMVPLSASVSRDILFVLNQAAWLGLGVVLWRWFQPPLLLLGVLAVTLTPVTHTGRLGQVNGIVALLVAAALWRRSGGLMSVAAMIKMSPALYLPVWAAQGRWRPVLMSVAGAVGLSVLALLVAPLELQMHFYRDMLPGFSSGAYNSLQVPVGLNANHSVPSLLNVIWPGPDAYTLSAGVRTASAVLLLLSLSLSAWLSRRVSDVFSEACLFGALTVALVVLPVYAYEHHLALLAFPSAALGSALLSGRLPRWSWALALPSYLAVAWPLAGFRQALRAAPELAWLIRELKLLGAILLGVLCCWAALRGAAAERRS